MRSSLLFIVLCVFYLSVSGQCTSGRYLDTVFHRVTTTTGIKFGTADNQLGFSQDLYMDFYEPTGDTLARRPLIVYAFGGAFLIGTRNQPPIPTYCTYYAQCGYAVASIDYRIGFDVLSTGSAVRAVYRAAQDLRASVRFLCQRYPQYRIDTSAIFLTGSSAGCFSALHSCFMEPSDVPSYVQGIPLENTDLGCYDCSTNADNNRHMPQIRGIINHWGAMLDTIFIRPTAKDNVPVISLAGDQDALVPYGVGYPFSYPVFPTVYGSLPIHYRMDHLGIKNELHPLYGQGHEPWLLAPQLLDTCFKYERPFLYSILKPLPIAITGRSTLCVGDTATLSVPQRDGSHYCWAFAGGTPVSSTNNTVTLRWPAAGIHLITVREMSRNDVNGDLDSFIVTTLSPPVAAFGDSVLHTDVRITDSSQGATSWLYTFDGGASTNLHNPSHYFADAGPHTVSLIVSNGYCADTISRIVVTDTCPQVHIQYTISHDTVYASAEPADAVTYAWTFGDGATDSSGAAVYHVYSHTQHYLVGVSLTTAKACSGFVSQIVDYQQPATGLTAVEEQSYRIYPNPAHSEVNVDCSDCEVTIYDCLGRGILSKYELHGGIVDISGLDAGIYDICITAAGQKSRGRLVIR